MCLLFLRCYYLTSSDHLLEGLDIQYLGQPYPTCRLYILCFYSTENFGNFVQDAAKEAIGLEMASSMVIQSQETGEEAKSVFISPGQVL